MGQLADTFFTPASGVGANLPPGAFWAGTGDNRVLILPLTGLVIHACRCANGPFVPKNSSNPTLQEGDLALNL